MNFILPDYLGKLSPSPPTTIALELRIQWFMLSNECVMLVLTNFILIGPFKVFQSEVVRPLKRSYAARQSLLQSFDAVSQSNSNTISNKVYSAIEITSEGLNILRKLHKQVILICCSDLFARFHW
jgi:hypothetical protein